MQSARVCLGAAVASALWLLTSPAFAFTHVVQAGESLASIATRMYGDPKQEALLATANGLDTLGGVAPLPGMRLEIPAPAHYRVAPGDTWPAIASRFLGEQSRADVLARANGAVAWVPPERGLEVVIPYVLTLVVVETDRLDAIAKRFWGEPNRAWEINSYNLRKDVALRRGEVLLIPLTKLALTADGKADAKAAGEFSASEGEGVLREAQSRSEAFVTELPELRRRGRWVDIVQRGSAVIGSGAFIPRQEAAIQLALVEALVALDAKEAAARACVRWRLIDPQGRLDPVQTSPKVRAACATR